MLDVEYSSSRARYRMPNAESSDRVEVSCAAPGSHALLAELSSRSPEHDSSRLSVDFVLSTAEEPAAAISVYLSCRRRLLKMKIEPFQQDEDRTLIPSCNLPLLSPLYGFNEARESVSVVSLARMGMAESRFS